MAITIPTQIEQDIQAGKAQYKTFQTGFGAQSLLPVGPNSYIVIFGYVLNPAGGGWTRFDSVGGINQPTPNEIAIFGAQQVLFYTGDDFFPFMHFCDVRATPVVTKFNPATGDTTITSLAYEVDTRPQEYGTYIVANQSVSIAHGVVLDSFRNITAPVPATGEMPLGLSYGGSGLNLAVQTDLNTPMPQDNQFLQPDFTRWSIPPFSYGLIPAGAISQAWAGIDSLGSAGMIPAQNALSVVGQENKVPSNYFITCHYALYMKPTN